MHGEGKDHIAVRPQWEGGQLWTKERGQKEPKLQYFDLGLLASRSIRKLISVVQAIQSSYSFKQAWWY